MQGVSKENFPKLFVKMARLLEPGRVSRKYQNFVATDIFCDPTVPIICDATRYILGVFCFLTAQFLSSKDGKPLRSRRSTSCDHKKPNQINCVPS
jgi:hypothetical protein